MSVSYFEVREETEKVLQIGVDSAKRVVEQAEQGLIDAKADFETQEEELRKIDQNVYPYDLYHISKIPNTIRYMKDNLKCYEKVYHRKKTALSSSQQALAKTLAYRQDTLAKLELELEKEKGKN